MSGFKRDKDAETGKPIGTASITIHEMHRPPLCWAWKIDPRFSVRWAARFGAKRVVRNVMELEFDVSCLILSSGIAGDALIERAKHRLSIRVSHFDAHTVAEPHEASSLRRLVRSFR